MDGTAPTPRPVGDSIPTVICPQCKGRNIASNDLCTACGNSLEGASPWNATTAGQSDFPGTESAGVLRALAWLTLIGGVIGALAIYATYGTVGSSDTYGYVTQQSNPVAGWIAAAVFAQGIVACVLFHAVAAAAENSAEIRRTLAEMRKN